MSDLIDDLIDFVAEIIGDAVSKIRLRRKRKHH